MREVLTLTDHDDLVGPYRLNVVDALMVIGQAINRLAAAQEHRNDREDHFTAEEFKEAVDRAALALNEGKPGHA